MKNKIKIKNGEERGLFLYNSDIKVQNGVFEVNTLEIETENNISIRNICSITIESATSNYCINSAIFDNHMFRGRMLRISDGSTFTGQTKANIVFSTIQLTT